MKAFFYGLAFGLSLAFIWYSITYTHRGNYCTAQEPINSSFLMNSMKSGNVESFLNTWAPENRPFAVNVSNYMPPKEVTITKIQWIGSCANYKGTMSIYNVSISSDFLTYDVIVQVQTNTEGQVISEE